MISRCSKRGITLLASTSVLALGLAAAPLAVDFDLSQPVFPAIKSALAHGGEGGEGGGDGGEGGGEGGEGGGEGGEEGQAGEEGEEGEAGEEGEEGEAGEEGEEGEAGEEGEEGEDDDSAESTGLEPSLPTN